jgi:hypothetical protein
MSAMAAQDAIRTRKSEHERAAILRLERRVAIAIRISKGQAAIDPIACAGRSFADDLKG